MRSNPPGRLRRRPDGTLGLDRPEQADQPAQWTLDALAAAVQAEGIQVGRSQVRCILQAEGVCWSTVLLKPKRRCGLRPKRAAIIILYTAPPAGVTVVCADELGPVIPRSFPPASGWSTEAVASKRR